MPVERAAEVSARLDGSILQVSCQQLFINKGTTVQEVEVLLPIPADAVVTDGMLLADGQEIRAEVLPAAEARSIYESIVRQRRDPALIELAGHGLVRLSAFPIPPHGRRTVSYRFHQTIPGIDGRTRLALPVAALCGIDGVGPVRFDLAIDGQDPLVQVYSPSHHFEIDRTGPTSASLCYADDSPDPRETIEVSVVRGGESIGIDLRTARERGEDGYFLLAVSPGWNLLKGRERSSEAVTFVLDRSGSMEGEKFDQARRALESFVREIPPRDRFNLIAFSDQVEILFDDGPRQTTAATRRQAQRWIDRLHAGGGTALDDALQEAGRVTPAGGLILLLTDGQPTVGETDRQTILENVRHPRREQRFYAFGVGYDVDARLLDALAEQGNGSVSYVRPGEEVENAVSLLRRRVGHPCAQNVRIDVKGARIHDTFPAGEQVLFAGEPLIFAGRVGSRARAATVTITADGPDGRRLAQSWRVDFGDPDARSSAVPVLWASRKAASLIATLRRDGRDPRTLDALRELSRRYGILNEEVALLAREDEAPLLASRDQAPRGGGWKRFKDLPHRPIDRLPPTGVTTHDQGVLAAPPMPSGSTNPGISAQREEFDMSVKTWELRDARLVNESKLEAVGVITAGERTFRKIGEVWVDTRIVDPLPKGTKTIRVRSFSDASFQLAAADKRFAAWIAVGERVRIALSGIVLEVSPDGEEILSKTALEEILDAAARD